MSYITSKRLIGLQVFTESGIFVGKVFDLEINLESHAILRYIIKSRLGAIVAKELIITPAEIVSISAEKMIIKDGTVRELAEARGAVFAG